MTSTPFSRTNSQSSCIRGDFQSDADYEYESDIVDQCGGMIDDLVQEEIPQRPSSRLGFHSPTECLSTELTNWALPRVPNAETGDDPELGSVDLASAATTMAYDMGEDITTVATQDNPQDEQGGLLSMCPIGVRINSASQPADSNPFLTSDDEPEYSDAESDCSSCENSDEDFEFSLSSITSPSKYPLLPAPTFLAPVARLPSPQPQSSSPLPTPAEPPSPPALRLPSPEPSYHNHGYSRHALDHLKWFWAAREGKWAEHDAQMQSSKAYGGITGSVHSNHSNGRSTAQRNLAQRVKTFAPPPRHSVLPPLSVHPRRGDITSLRDPYCMHMDRCFVNLPNWTLAKTMYMVDVHIGHEWQTRVAELAKWRKECGDKAEEEVVEVKFRSGVKQKEPSTDTLDDGDLDSESESVCASASVASSEDSDATLVESENEGDGEREDYATFAAFMTAGPSSPSSSSENDTPRLKYSSSTSSPSDKRSPASSYSPSLYAYVTSPGVEFFSSFDEGKKPWATNWYRRWEILTDLLRFNWDQRQLIASLNVNGYNCGAVQPSCSTSGDDDAAGRKGKRRLKRQPRFYIDNENSREDTDSWEWDPSFDWKSRSSSSELSFGLGVTALDGSVLL